MNCVQQFVLSRHDALDMSSLSSLTPVIFPRLLPSLLIMAVWTIGNGVVNSWILRGPM